MLFSFVSFFGLSIVINTHISIPYSFTIFHLPSLTKLVVFSMGSNEDRQIALVWPHEARTKMIG